MKTKTHRILLRVWWYVIVYFRYLREPADNPDDELPGMTS